MNPKKLQWLIEATSHIPDLFKAIENGEDSATIVLGERVINGRLVRLSWKTEAVDMGFHGKSETHGSSQPPDGVNSKPVDRADTIHRRYRKRKRW